MIPGAGPFAADLLIGSTILLGCGALIVLRSRVPVHRQRAAELAVIATLAWLVLALLPLPRRARDAASSPAVGPTIVVVAPSLWRVASPRAASPPGDDQRRVAARASGSSASVSTVQSDAGSAASRERASAERGRVEDGGLPLPARVLLAVYALGALAAVAHALLGTVLVRHLVSRASPAPLWLAELFASRRAALGVHRCRLRLTAASRRPLSAGIVHATVVLPVALVDAAREEELRCVIDHELVHVARRDVASRAFFALAAAPLWVHPLFWFLRARAALAAELIADDAAAEPLGRRAYARTLMALAEELHSLKSAPSLVPGTYRHATELTRRIEMLITKHDRLAMRWTPVRRAVHLAAATAAVALCALAFGVRPVPAAASAPGTALRTTDATAPAGSSLPADLLPAGAHVADGPAQAKRQPVRAGRQPVQRQPRGQPQQRQHRQPPQAEKQAEEQPAGQPPQQNAQQPKQDVRQPQQNAQQPKQDVQQPQQNAQRPKQDVQQPQQNAQRPKQDVQQPQQNAPRPRQGTQQPRQQSAEVQLAPVQEPDPGYAATLALAERAITLKSELETGAMELRELEERARAGIVQESEAIRARTAFRRMEEQLGLVLILVDAEIQAIQLEMAEIEEHIQLGQLGTSGRAEQVRLQARLRVLQSVR